MPKAQAGLEMFLVLSVTLLVLFWFSNYLGVFGETAYDSGLNAQQRLANRDLARLASTVCVSGVNLTVKAPCLQRESESVLYQVYNESEGGTGYSKLRMHNGVTDLYTYENSSCYVDSRIADYIQCSSFEALCMRKLDGNVVITRGACA